MLYLAFLLLVALAKANATTVNLNFNGMLDPNGGSSSSSDDDGSCDEPTGVSPSDTINVNFGGLFSGVDVRSFQRPLDCENVDEFDFDFEMGTFDVAVESLPGICRGKDVVSEKRYCVFPGTEFSIEPILKNTGNQLWAKYLHYLQLVSHVEEFGQVRIPLEYIADSGVSVPFSTKMMAPMKEGVFPLNFEFFGPCGVIGDFTFDVEITCSDQVYCNGVEHLIDGQCQAGNDPCDDGHDCTIDTCDEVQGRCSYSLADENDTSCICKCDSPCDPEWECGEGCFGPCNTCSDGFSCQSHKCIETSTLEGTCEMPFELKLGQAVPLDLDPNSSFQHYADFDGAHYGLYKMIVDTSKGSHKYTPLCNVDSLASEVFISFTTPADFPTTFMDARMTGKDGPRSLDTVLEVFIDGCGDSNRDIARCSDDSTPPSFIGSRILMELQPSTTYNMLLDGYNSRQVGEALLLINLLPEVNDCDGKLCGIGDGPSGERACLGCPSGQFCDPDTYRCKASTCTPVDCLATNRTCGSDGCDPWGCGHCSGNMLCATDVYNGNSQFCAEFPVCNHMNPTCPPCAKDEYCGADCQCHHPDEKLPDIVVDASILVEQIVHQTRNFGPNHCALVEGCILNSGRRRLLRFSVQSTNVGFGDIRMPLPATRPDIFQYSPCHEHYHASGFADYQLLRDGKLVERGHKQAYCLEDTSRHEAIIGPDVKCEGVSTCSEPGISRGYSDYYGQDLDCSFIDVTDLEPGLYHLRVEINPFRNILESNYENNVAMVPIELKPYDPTEEVL